MTPHFTIRVWAPLDAEIDRLDALLGLSRRRQAVAEIDVDTTGLGDWDLRISGHRGLDLIPQKMLTSGG